MNNIKDFEKYIFKTSQVINDRIIFNSLGVKRVFDSVLDFNDYLYLKYGVEFEIEELTEWYLSQKETQNPKRFIEHKVEHKSDVFMNTNKNVNSTKFKYMCCSCGSQEFIRTIGTDIVKIKMFDSYDEDEEIDEVIDQIYKYRCLKCGNEDL